MSDRCWTAGAPGIIVCASAIRAGATPRGTIVGASIRPAEESNGGSTVVSGSGSIAAWLAACAATGGGGVSTPVAVVRRRPALQRGQPFAEAGTSLPQRVQTMGCELGGFGTTR